MASDSVILAIGLLGDWTHRLRLKHSKRRNIRGFYNFSDLQRAFPSGIDRLRPVAQTVRARTMMLVQLAATELLSLGAMHLGGAADLVVLGF